MIDNYDEIMAEWASNTCCTNMMEISPDMDLRRWAVKQTVMMLANADYYYTKDEVNHLIEMATASGVTSGQVEDMIAVAIATKANQSDLEALSAQVQTQATEILNRYTKSETNTLLESYLTKLKANEMFGNYTKVEGTTLVLNAENITI